ncbi:Vps5-domain-containing protein [Basidiobolus meristosporus CBS 931.73]|uniref:Vps5-domain-containing protein n=1 Tax=Basidiobolus meristosporus CBS 931.73 TaxID=1314790 RepID=A0A1Y1Y4A7_9FUNG|nr:Vps5-domain-containing protein [Basidiobolus meristosporus CBS 931.73]|eukprot:ORX92861.1 Vps5-domain-containing protein [Basidiobolus meristosporus CBS 931.73]
MSKNYFYDDFSDLLSSQEGLSVKYEEVNPFADVFSNLPSSLYRENDSFEPSGFIDPYQEDHLQASFSNLNFGLENERPDNRNDFSTEHYHDQNKTYSPTSALHAQEFQKISFDSTPSEGNFADSSAQTDSATTQPAEEQYPSPPLDPKGGPVSSDLYVKSSIREPTYNILGAQNPSTEKSPKHTKQVNEEQRPNSLTHEPEDALAEVALPPEATTIDPPEENLTNGANSKEIDSILDISVCEPQKVGDPINSYIVYKVKAQVTVGVLNHRKSSVTRRYRDFLWLYNQLANNHPGVIIPPVPEKHALGRFQDEFVETRRIALETFLQKIAAHPKLKKDPDFLLFMESERFGSEMKERKNTGSKGLMKVFGEAVSSATNFLKFVESDEWIEKKRAQIDVLESQLKPLSKVFENYVKHRKGMCAYLGGTYLEFSQGIEALAEAEPNQPLTNNLLALSEVQKKIKDLQNKQATYDTLTLENTLNEYLRTIGSIRQAFSARVKAYQSWQGSAANFNQKRAQLEKFRTQAQAQERINLATQDAKEASKEAEREKLKFDAITDTLKQELARFDNEKVIDFKNAIEKCLRATISIQMEIISLWEGYMATTDEAQNQLFVHLQRQRSDGNSTQQ